MRAVLVTTVGTRVDLESPADKKKILTSTNFPASQVSLVKDLLVPLEVEHLPTTLVTFNNTSLVDLSHVQVKSASIAEGHRVASRAFERS